ncbi:MAG: hypothetical protein ACI4QL_00550 [Candidatus Fimimonas sp.]
MQWFEILLVVASVLFVVGVVVTAVVKRKKGAGCDFCDCGSCSARCCCKSDVSHLEPQNTQKR